MAAVSETGELCWHENYSPYGEKSVGDDVVSTKGCGILGEERGFTSHTVDYDTDLVYMQQRYYDPTIGRFLSADPVTFLQSGNIAQLNRYSYAYNNPVNFVDPDGRWAEDLAIGIPSIVIGIHSFFSNISNGNWVEAGVDFVGVGIDLFATATPGVPGATGLGIQASRKATDKLDDTVSIFKAPGRGKGKDQFENGYDPKEFCDGDQCAYFAKEKSLADEYAKHYGDGVIEL